LSVGELKAVNWPKGHGLGLNFYCGYWLEASPVIHAGLGYVVSCDGVLAVFDVATREGVYRKALPADLFHGAHARQNFGASVTLAGSCIYLMGSTGVTIVIKPGRKYEELARNRIQCLAQAAFFPEGQRRLFKGRTLGNYGYFAWNPQYCPEYQECTMTSTPIFEGGRMYFRGEENLYCIEEGKP
jgi:hypothetical protein